MEPTLTSTERADAWRALAQSALDRYEVIAGSAETAHAVAFSAQAHAWLSPDGWADTTALARLDQVRGMRNPDGGWGLPTGYDFAADGSVNPPNTTYTVTLSDHVGPVLVDAYRHGAASKDEVKAVVDLLMSTPRIQNANSAYGQCVAYSRSPNDQQPGHAVHNVNASVGRFLTDVNAAGVGAGGLAKLVVDITRREVFAYQPLIDGRQAWWRYMDTRTLNDADHNSFAGESMYYLCYPVGREAVYQHMATAWADNAQAPLAHLRLVALPGGPGSWAADGVTPLWQVMGDRWLPEAAAYVAAANSRQAAQAAYYCARNARACTPGGTP